MNEEWKIRGIGYIASGHIQYDWSHVKTSCNLTSDQAETLREKGYWLKLLNDRNYILLSKDATEQTAIENDLTNMNITFTTENIAPTEREKIAITNAKITRRDQIKAVLDKDKTVEIEIPSLQTALNTIDNISNLSDAKKVLKKLVKVIFYLHDL